MRALDPAWALTLLAAWRDSLLEAAASLNRLSMASKALEFRKEAEDSCKRAESAAGSFEKKHWLEVAAYWLRMAAAEEGRNEGDPPPP